MATTIYGVNSRAVRNIYTRIVFHQIKKLDSDRGILGWFGCRTSGLTGHQLRISFGCFLVGRSIDLEFFVVALKK